MKCDHIRTREQGDTPFFPNMLNNGKVKICLKEDVDAAIAELKEFAEDACLERDDNQNAIDELQAENVKLKAENKLLKEHIANGDVSRITWIDEVIELKQKLEDVQASMYADVVDANMEVRRLKRALYIVLARSFCYMRELAARNAMYDDECKWDNFKTTCLKKAEEYK